MYYFSASVLHNPKFFKDPSAFRPERFIDAKGEFIPDEKVIYFGTGKRLDYLNRNSSLHKSFNNTSN